MSRKRGDRLLPPGTMVLACRVFEPELSALGLKASQVTYLDQGLHRYPKDLRQSLGREIATLENRPELSRVILGYGLCGGGLDGIGSARLELVLPLVHDCIPLLLGRSEPGPNLESQGAFYLSPGWIDHGKTPFSEYRLTARKFGHDDAVWVAREMLKGYSQVVLINTVAGIKRHHRRYARRMAELFELDYRETRGSSARLSALLTPRKSKEVLILPPGRHASPGMYPQTKTPSGYGDERPVASHA